MKKNRKNDGETLEQVKRKLPWEIIIGRNERIRKKFYNKGDFTGWFESVYAVASGAEEEIPWARMVANKLYVKWANKTNLCGKGKLALVVGCGLGDDAQELAERGFQVTAFDISASAIQWCGQRFPDSSVNYQVADLFHPPRDWLNRFDFVLESATLQALPQEIRSVAMRRIEKFLRSEGTLLVICIAAQESEGGGGGNDQDELPPWPLNKAELDVFKESGLEQISFEEVVVRASRRPGIRYRVEYQKSGNL